MELETKSPPHKIHQVLLSKLVYPLLLGLSPENLIVKRKDDIGEQEIRIKDIPFKPAIKLALRTRILYVDETCYPDIFCPEENIPDGYDSDGEAFYFRDYYEIEDYENELKQNSVADLPDKYNEDNSLIIKCFNETPLIPDVDYWLFGNIKVIK